MRKLFGSPSILAALAVAAVVALAAAAAALPVVAVAERSDQEYLPLCPGSIARLHYIPAATVR